MTSNVPKLYYEKLDLLQTRLCNASTKPQEKIKECDEFLSNYLLLPEFWVERLKLQFKYRQMSHKKLNQAMFDFYSIKIFDSISVEYLWQYKFNRIPFDRIMTDRSFEIFKQRCETLEDRREVKTCESFIKDFLSFPHSKLKEALKIYNEFSGKFVTKEIYKLCEKSQRQYDQILAVWDNIEEWFKLVTETKDMRFIVQNVEARISEEYFNIKLWRLYIMFLKTLNKSAAYEVYFRYKRLFLDDKKFENDFQFFTKKPAYSGKGFLQNLKFGTSIMEITEPHKRIPQLPPTVQHLNSRKLSHQSFKFPVKMIEAIIKNANSVLIKKLYYCSKYFYIKSKKNFCHTLFLGDCIPQFYSDSLQLNEKHLNYNLLKKIETEESLYVGIAQVSYHNLAKRNLLLKAIPYLRCESIRVLKITRQHISVKEYNILTEHGNIEKIILFFVSIFYNDDNVISLFDIFKTLPKATFIKISDNFIAPPETWKDLALLERKSKIKHLFLSNRIPVFDNSFLNFLFSHCAEEAIVYYPFHNNFNYDQIIENMEKLIDASKNQNNTKLPKINLKPNANFFVEREQLLY